LLSSNISSTCPHNMVNFGLLAAEIVSLVWGTPGNFNGFRILAALLHGTLVVGVSQTAAFNRGRHLYSAGRPSAHVLVLYSFTSHANCKTSHVNIVHHIISCHMRLSFVRLSARIQSYCTTYFYAPVSTIVLGVL